MSDTMYNALYDTDQFVNLIYSILSGGFGILVTIGAIAGIIVTFLLTVAQWVLLAMPLFAIAKKTGRKYGWVAWIPILGDYCRMFTLSDIPGEKEFELFGKIRIKSRILVFLIWLGVAMFGNLVWDVVMNLIGTLTTYTGLGPILTSLLSLVPNVFLGFVEFVFLRDVLDMFNPDKKSNMTWAIVATVVDAILPWRFATTVCMFMLMKKEPLIEAEPIEVPTEEPAAALEQS